MSCLDETRETTDEREGKDDVVDEQIERRTGSPAPVRLGQTATCRRTPTPSF